MWYVCHVFYSPQGEGADQSTLSSDLAKAVREKEELMGQITQLEQKLSELKDKNNVCVCVHRLGRRRM